MGTGHGSGAPDSRRRPAGAAGLTRYGLLLDEGERAPADLLRALAAHPTERRADLTAVWSRATSGLALDWRVLEELRRAGIEPIVYAETTGWQPSDILAGLHDAKVSLLASRSRGALIRILHEPNGRLFDWSRWPIPMYLDVWHRLAELIRAEGARIAYCVVHRGKDREHDMFRHWPGAEWVDAVGIDEFRRGDEPMPPQKWAGAIAAFAERAPGVPFHVYETGAEVGKATQRAEFIASQADVVGAAGILTFDRLIDVPSPPAPSPIHDDFRWGSGMTRAWDRLPLA